MMIQNSLLLLQELCELEENIQLMETYISQSSFEIDMEELLCKALATYRKQRD